VTTRRPAADEYVNAFGNYIALVPETDVVAALEEQQRNFEALATSISEERSSFRYAEGKWSIRQLVRHVTDGERVFSYRALTFARESGADLPGFEENEWAAVAPADEVPFADLVSELVHVRAANVLMFRHLREGDWDKRGKASGNELTVRAIAFALVGHARHHLRMLEERYLGA
jgi:hypothetical protein